MAAKCPLCFGPRREGDLLQSDPDIIVAVDGNFNHSRTETAAKNDFANLCPPIFLESRFVEKAQLAVGVSREKVADVSKKHTMKGPTEAEMFEELLGRLEG